MAERLTIDDFISGLFAALAVQGHRALSIRTDHFDSAVERAYQALLERAARDELDIRFRVKRHPIHGDSPSVRDAITKAVQRDLISLDNPEYQDIRVKLDDAAANQLLKGMPSTPALYAELARVFLDAYEDAA